MRIAAIAAAAAAMVPAQAMACPPPPPGYVPPTEEKIVERSLIGVSDIVYGVITRSGPSAAESRLKVLHVYKGNLKKGDTVKAPPGWGHPAPFCLGMMAEAPQKPVGTYGVVVLKPDRWELNFVTPEHVQIMIREGWIRSARARG